ncbi:hypothetical protein ACT009_07365 [Sphingomonas sp. Tas61C01]|uniref:hypothetical protein n=1 Tax=Sphingomonas sp. Tas61C01 TaxID=3458297 RepID=UPI00403E39FF
MPVKDLVGPPRPTAEERAMRKEMMTFVERMLRKRRGDSDDGDLSPVWPPNGPSPLPLAGAAELDDG